MLEDLAIILDLLLDQLIVVRDWLPPNWLISMRIGMATTIILGLMGVGQKAKRIKARGEALSAPKQEGETAPPEHGQRERPHPLTAIIIIVLALIVYFVLPSPSEGQTSLPTIDSNFKVSIVGQLVLPAGETKDFVIGVQDKIHVYHELPTGGHALVQVISDCAYAPRLGDFDGDGYIDLACIRSTYKGALVYFNDGTGRFFDPAVLPNASSNPEFNFISLLPADVNNDGITDIISDKMILRPGYLTPIIIATPYVIQRPSPGATFVFEVNSPHQYLDLLGSNISDSNRDGYLDLFSIIRDPVNNGIFATYHRNNGVAEDFKRLTPQGLFFALGLGELLRATPISAFVYDSESDFNNDGFPDVLFSNTPLFSDIAQLHYSPSIPLTTSHTYRESPPLGNETVTAISGIGMDLNRNGKPDLLLGGFENATNFCKLFATNGETFEVEHSYDFCATVFRKVNLDDDGLLDVALLGNDTVRFIRNLGNFELQQIASISIKGINEEVAPFDARGLQHQHPYYNVKLRAAGFPAKATDTGRFAFFKLSQSPVQVTAESDRWKIPPIETATNQEVPSLVSLYGERLSDPLPSSPIYSLWNGFLDMINILELINRSNSSNSVNVKIFAINGELVHQHSVDLAPLQQFDLILNDLPGFTKNSYGLVHIEATQQLNGRMSYYREKLGGKGSYDFAFAVPFSQPAIGPSSVAFNTHNPSLKFDEKDDLVYNWLTIVNISPNARSFEINKYSQAGNLLSQRVEVIPGFGRVDLDGGHQVPGPASVGLNIVRPLHSDPYILQLIRYGSRSSPGEVNHGFNFAFALSGANAADDALTVPISSFFGEDNWVEVANTSAQPAAVDVNFFDHNGNFMRNEKLSLPPFGQHHLYATQHLNNLSYGQVQIVPERSGQVIAQSMFYFRHPQNSGITSMYGSIARQPTRPTLSGSYNLFLNMENWLTITNPSPEDVEIQLAIANAGFARNFTLSPHETRRMPIHDFAHYGTTANSYGQIQISASRAIITELLRLKYELPLVEQYNFTDFAMPTDFN